MVVLCGYYTDNAKGVSPELTIAQEENIPYFLLCGRQDGRVVKPFGVRSTDKIYMLTWNNLKALLNGDR